METQVSLESNSTKEVKVVKAFYELRVNPKEGAYHPLPKKLRKEEARPSYISSEFIGNGGMSILRGLSLKQERYFSRELINKSPIDAGFDASMTEFWADFRITVPEKTPLKLNASYSVQKVLIDGKEEELEIPVNLFDYIKAHFAMKNSRVAFYGEEKANSSLYDFIMTDLSLATKERETGLKLKNIALEKYLELVKLSSEKNNNTVHYMLDVLQDPRENYFSMEVSDKLAKLNEIALENPSAFIAAYDDKNLVSKARLFRLTQTRIVSLEGSEYFFEDIALGDKEQAIAFLSDQTKSAIVQKMLAKMQELLK